MTQKQKKTGYASKFGLGRPSYVQHAESQKSMTPTLESIDHIHVFVTNREAAKTWYGEVLGLTPVARLEFWAVDGGPLTVADSEENVHIALFESAVVACRSTIAFAAGAEAFIAWQRHLSIKLKKTLSPADHKLSWSLYFSDPWGNPFEVTTYEYDAVSELLRAETCPKATGVR